MSSWSPTKYATRNWSDYNQALRQRGSLEVWFDLETDWRAKPTGKRGRHPRYSDAAIQACLTIKGEGRPGNRPVACFSPERADLLSQISPDQKIGSVMADGAYDTRKCHDAIAAREAHAVIAPRKNAKLWKPDTAGAIARNEAGDPQNISAEPFGDDGRGITAGAASKRNLSGSCDA